MSAEPVSRREVLERTIKVLKTFEKIDKLKLSADAKFTSTLGLDSLDHVEVLMALEEEFDVEIPDRVAESIQTPSDAVEYIHSELNQNEPEEDEDNHHGPGEHPSTKL
jgi:NADH dehydrogenase (ubiquinone) 1 alpha/beta subcomplex 1